MVNMLLESFYNANIKHYNKNTMSGEYNGNDSVTILYYSSVKLKRENIKILNFISFGDDEESNAFLEEMFRI